MLAHRILLLATLTACASAPADPVDDADDPSDGVLVPMPAEPESPHLGLGVPTDTSPEDDLLIVHPQMALGYSRFLNAPNWVSWRTRPIDFGPVDRYDGDFYADASLPSGYYRTEHADMYGSGYDRGHMLRSEERTRTSEENYATFVMTNVLPQFADLNRGPWFDFELYVQRKVESTMQPRDAYVVAGAVWSPACATHSPRELEDGCLDVGRTDDPAHRIAVPMATWKVVVFVDAGVALADAVEPYVVAVVMPNERGIGETRWYDYRSSIAAIEQATGYDLPFLE